MVELFWIKCVFFVFSDDRTSSLSETMKIGAFADRKKKHFEEPQLDLPFCTFFADRISLNDQQMDSEPQSLATSPENDRLSGKNVEVEDVAKQQRAENEKNERNGNVTTQQEVSMVSTGDDFIMVDLVIFFLADFCFGCFFFCMPY